MMQDSIYALSTPAGGAIALIRASGPLCADAVRGLTGRALMNNPRYMTRAVLTWEGSVIDEAMVVCFCAPKSYTGEDMLELHCHGSKAVINKVFAALEQCGLRPAEPGEFTRRAFLNGKLDLSQAEAVMDIIQAEADQSARAALDQLQGRLSHEIQAIEQMLYEALSGISAAIDYPDEIDEDVFFSLPGTLTTARDRLSELIEQGMKGRVLREGFRVVLLGAPNVGKSSLLNALLGYDRAIVTAQAGTTRDTLEETLLLDGYPFLLTDTAGLRQSEDDAEREGIARTERALDGADAALLLLDGSVPLQEDLEELLVKTEGIKSLLLRTKVDIPSQWDWNKLLEGRKCLDISAKTGEGLQALREALVLMAGPLADAYVTNRRHIKALKQAQLSVEQALIAQDADCASTDIRDALVSLGEITGSTVDDQVIEQIFARFCVGK